VVDRAPSDMDDLFDFRLTPSESAAQHPSRRAAREADSTRRAPSKRQSRAVVRSARARNELSRPSGERKAIAKAERTVEQAPMRRPRSLEPAAPATRKLRGSELRSMHRAAPKAPRKHPVSVLVTMAAVGGMFAVAGLPAYAVSNGTTTLAADDKKSSFSQSIIVDAQSASVAPTRDGYRATTPQQLAEMSKDALRAENNANYLASGARELGDDYPWPYELATFQGGGLSPLNYFYRECVDFVAWRLNRDAGFYEEPYKWVWSTLTPTGGNAYQWKYAWQSHGWTISSTPIVGSVAWFGSNHVSYVKAVLDGGYVLVEEYNFNPGVYGQRTLAISDVDAFLYPPPA
jgi:surface antigen